MLAEGMLGFHHVHGEDTPQPSYLFEWDGPELMANPVIADIASMDTNQLFQRRSYPKRAGEEVRLDGFDDKELRARQQDAWGDQVRSIASALSVAPESLFNVPAATAREALELIFGIDEEFGLKPKEVDGEVVLAINPSSKKAPKLAQALKAWLSQIDSEKSGEITSEQLAEWKAKFGA